MLRSLATGLFSGYQRRVLGLLLLHPDPSYHVREIARLTDTAPGTLHKELSRLASAGVLERERRGNQLAYRANRSCPIFQELALRGRQPGKRSNGDLVAKSELGDIKKAFKPFGGLAQERALVPFVILSVLSSVR